jgi:asparagine synthase (glutamine-hydrolysing)
MTGDGFTRRITGVFQKDLIMCGIIGGVKSHSKATSFSRGQFDALMDTMDYRGPDARDIWQHDTQPVILGHLRLSILDPRPEGTQPMHLDTANGRLSIVFNGEVYNFLEIREELKTLGYTFNTDTDTEVILAAYAAWGTECLTRFNGMYAIAIYNDKTLQTFLARDRVGIKPVYYAEVEEGVVFASEVKAIKSLVPGATQVSPDLIHHYMKYGYIPGTDTLNKGIKRLLPGHYAMIEPNGSINIHRYWSLHFPIKGDEEPEKDLAAYVAEGNALFNDSLDLRLRADVPVGVFLSGGLDSSAVVGALAQKLDRPIKTFSVRYDFSEFGEQYDESQYAEQIAKKFGTEHKTITMTPEDFEAYIPTFVATMDEPVTEAAALSLHFVSELAKEDVTVVLSGEGSDELFAGYDLYRYMRTLETCRKMVTPVGTRVAKAVAQALFPVGNKLRKYIELADLPFEQRYRGISVYEQGHAEKLYSEPMLNALDQAPLHEGFAQALMDKSAGADILNRMLHFDTHTWLVDDLLTKADRMSMGSSLELRVPFLDYRMVEFAARLPTKYKIHKKEGKFILKEMMKDILPDNIIHREKRGFPTPLKMMFMGPLKAYTERTLYDNDNLHIGEFFNHDYIRTLCDEHWADKADHHRLLWQLIVLEEWLKQNAQNG